MKKLLFGIILFFFCLTTIHAQLNGKVDNTKFSSKHSEQNSVNRETSPALDPVFFMLGTLSDYMGRFQYIDRQKQVDRYFPYEKPLVDYLTHYIKTELGISVDTTTDQSKHMQMYSAKLSRELDHFYGADDKLVDSLFQTPEQACSFLAGVYLRYGEKLDTSIYKIQLANSPKHQTCYELLKKVKCPQIFYKYLKNIPAQFILYFQPSPVLKKYLSKVEYKNEVLKHSFQHQVKELMNGNMTEPEVEAITAKQKNDELVKIKNAFK